MIESILQRYETPDADAYYQALREVMQEVALAGLYRGGFFSKAACAVIPVLEESSQRA